MMRGTLLAVLFAGACAVDDVGTESQAIIGGSTAHTAQFPTMVGLVDKNGNWWGCEGVLIDKDWILTTADCFTKDATGQNDIGLNFKVRFDSDNMTGSGGKTIGVTEVHKDTSFDVNSYFHNDLAVVKLAQSMTDRTPTTIARDQIALNTMVTKLGYGSTDGSQTGGGPLKQGQAPTMDCNTAGLSTVNLCFNASTSSSCYGDGGGPAFVQGTDGLHVAGVNSGGTGQQCNQGYDVYQGVYAELAFIDTYVPVQTVVPPPTGGGDGDPTQPTAPTDPTTGGDDTGGGTASGIGGAGCNAGGSSGFLSIALIGMALIRRKRS